MKGLVLEPQGEDLRSVCRAKACALKAIAVLLCLNRCLDFRAGT